MNSPTFWVYILHCNNHTYYTGYTTNLIERYASHLNTKGKCKYTRSFKPLGIAQCWKIKGDKALAMRIERYIKTLSRLEKEKLIAEPATLWPDKSVRPLSKKILTSLNARTHHTTCPAAQPEDQAH